MRTPTIRRLTTPLPLAGLLVALSGLAACGGDEDEPILFDPDRADEIAHAALPGLADLPGTGWALVAMDDFSEDEDPPADTESCREMSELADKVEETTDAARAGRAKIEAERPGRNEIDTEVEVSVNIFENVEAPKEAMDVFDDYFSSSSLRECFNDLLVLAMAEMEDVEVEADLVEPTAERPEGSEATAFVVKVSAGELSVEFRAELYAWRHSNAGISVEVMGAPEDVTPERVAGLLKMVDDRVVALAKED